MIRSVPATLAWFLPLVAMVAISGVVLRFGNDGAEATTPYSGPVPIAWRLANPPEMRACVIGSATGAGTFDQQSRDGATSFADRLDALGYSETRHIGQNITWANIVDCVRTQLGNSDTNDLFVYYHTTHGNRDLADGAAPAREPQNPQCQEVVADALDDDFDGWVNDGCDAVVAAEVACDDRLDNDGDNRVNDGCAQRGDPNDEPDNTVAAGDGEQPEKQPGLPGQMVAEINGPDGHLQVSGAEVRDDALAAEIARELVGKPDIGVIVIIDSCFAGEHADGTSDNGRGDMQVMLRQPNAILMATERQYTCFSEDGTQPDRYAGGTFNRAGAFTNYLIKGLETTATKAACQGNATGRADAVGSGVPGAEPNNFGQPVPNLDCITTARELFNFSSQRTASSQADSDDYDGVADDGGANPAGVDPHFDADGDCQGGLPANPAAPGARAGPCATAGGINEDPPEFFAGVGSVNDDGDARTDEDGLSFSGLTSCNAQNSGADRCRQYPQFAGGGTYGGPKLPPTPTPKDPGGDTDGDGDPNATDPDDDNDGCTDVKEAGSNQVQGGRRNPHHFWDFFDTPQPPAYTRDRVVVISDILRVVQRFGSSRPGGPPSKGVAFAEAFATSPAPPAYHAGYDRTPSSVGSEPWRTNPPNGSISTQDILLIVQQYGHSCN